MTGPAAESWPQQWPAQAPEAVCAACDQTLDLRTPHLTVSIQTEVEDSAGVVSVHRSQVLSHLHQRCAPRSAT